MMGVGDVRTRTLEREAAQGDTVARAGLLRARLRAGRLCPERLRLAGYLGDPVAREALGADAPALRPDQEVWEWTRGFAAWGAEPALRGIVALARQALPHCEGRLLRPEVAHEAIHAAEAFLDARTPAALERARAAVELLDRQDVMGSSDEDEDPRDVAASALAVVRELAAVVHCHTPGDPRVAEWASPAAYADFCLHCARKPSLVLGDERLREALQAALVPWALGGM